MSGRPVLVASPDGVEGMRSVSFSARPLSLPVRPGPALAWALVMLLIANLGRIPVLSTGTREATIVANDVAVTGLAAFTVMAAILRRSLLLDSVAVFALLFAAVGLGSAVSAGPRLGLSAFQIAIGLTYLARWLTYFCVYLFVINNVRFGQIDDIWRMLLKVMLAFAAFGVFQSIFLPGFAQMVYPDSMNYVDWDPQGHRLVSTVLEPNIAASMIVLVLLVLLAQISVGSKVPWWKPGLLLMALAMTLSRSGVLALMAGLVVVVGIRGLSVRMLKLFGAIGFLSLALIPRMISFAQEYGKFEVGSGTSAAARVGSWLAAIETIAAHPVLGVGFNTYGFYREANGLTLRGASTYGADGGLLFITAMTGVVGLALYLWMLSGVVKRCRRVWRNESISADHRGLAIGATAGIVAITVHSLFVNSILTTFVMELMWVQWGLAFVIDRFDPGEARVAT